MRLMDAVVRPATSPNQSNRAPKGANSKVIEEQILRSRLRANGANIENGPVRVESDASGVVKHAGDRPTGLES